MDKSGSGYRWLFIILAMLISIADTSRLSLRRMVWRDAADSEEPAISRQLSTVALPAESLPRLGRVTAVSDGYVLGDEQVRRLHGRNCSRTYSRNSIVFAELEKTTNSTCYFDNGFLTGFIPFVVNDPWLAFLAVSRQLRYVRDETQYGEADIFVTGPEAFRRRQGDCEDHAILLADWLSALGYDARVVIGTMDGSGHAWVVWLTTEQHYLLEATEKFPRRALPLATLHTNYSPRLMFNATTVWTRNPGTADTDYSSGAWTETGVFKPYQSPAEQLLHFGVAALEVGSFEEGVGLLKSVLVLQPNDHEAHRELGRAAFKQRRYQEAEKRYREALRLQPADSDARLGLGKTLLQQRRPGEAAREFKIGLSHTPKMAELKFQLGYAFIEARKFEEAAKVCEDYTRLVPSDEVGYHNLGVALENLERIPEAVVAYKRALAINPKYKLSQTALQNLR